MRIGDLARETGVSIRSLRYYDEQRLLPADRNPSGQRIYGADAVDRVRLIQCLYSAKLPSRTIAVLLECEGTQRVTPEMLEEVDQQRNRIAQQIEELTEARERLDALARTIAARVSVSPPPRTG